MRGHKALEKVFLKHEDDLAGGDGVEGLYGSLTTASMAGVFSDWPAFQSNSIMLDIGCGIGRPQAQALVQFNVSCSVGVEIDEVKCIKAVSFIQRVAKDMGMEQAATSVKIIHSNSSKLDTLEPCTHLYLCWQGWKDIDKVKMGTLVEKSTSVFCVCTVQHKGAGFGSVKALREAGWPELQLIRSRNVYLVESNEILQAHTYLVSGRNPSPAIRKEVGLLAVPAHKGAAAGRITRQRVM